MSSVHAERPRVENSCFYQVFMPSSKGQTFESCMSVRTLIIPSGLGMIVDPLTIMPSLLGMIAQLINDMEKLRCNAGSHTLCGLDALHAFFLIISF